MRLTSCGFIIPLLIVLTNSFDFYTNISFSIGTSKFLEPDVVPYNGTHVFLLPKLSSNNLTYTLYNCKIAFNTSSLITSTNIIFTNPITDCSLRLAKQNLLLSFQTSIGCEVRVLHVYTLQQSNSFPCDQITMGTYLWNFDLFSYLSTDQKLYYDIQGNSSLILANYTANSNTRVRQKSQLSNLQKTKIYNFDKDKTWFTIRQFSSCNNIVNQFMNPTYIGLNETDFQCSFITSQDKLHILTKSQRLLIFSNTSNSYENYSLPLQNITGGYLYNSSIGLNIALIQKVNINNFTLIQVDISNGSAIIVRTSPSFYPFPLGDLQHPCFFYAYYFNTLYIVSKGQLHLQQYQMWVASLINISSVPPCTYKTTNSTVNSTNSTIDSTNVTLNSTNSTINSTNSTINSTNSTVNSTNSTVNSTNSTVNSTNSTINSMNSTINSTNSTVNSTNSTVNSTNSTINSTNSTINSTNSSVNSTNSTLNSTNSTVNSTNFSNGSTINDTYQTTGLNFNIQILNNLLSNAIITTLSKVPAGRKVIPFLCFLINLDQLWLYQYHQRYYGETINEFFNHLQKLQNEKWSMIGDANVNKIYQHAGINQTDIFHFIDTKKEYSGSAFRTREDRGETFLPACWEFLTFNLIFVLVGFFLLRWGFYLLFNYRISILLRIFSSLVFLAPLLFEGNLQYFFFLLFSQISLGFSLTPKDKLFNVLNYLIYFVILWTSVVSSFVAYYLNKKLTKYIIDNWRSRVEGLIAFSITNSIRMFIFGAIHSLLRSHSLQLPLLLLFEAVYVTILMFYLKMKLFHKVNFKLCFTIIFSVLRMVLQSALWFQQRYGIVNSGSPQQKLLQEIVGMVLIVYVITFYFATLWELVYEVLQIFFSDSKKGQQENKKKKLIKKQKILESQKENQIFIGAEAPPNTQRGQKEKVKERESIIKTQVKQFTQTKQKLAEKAINISKQSKSKTVQFMIPTQVQ